MDTKDFQRNFGSSYFGLLQTKEVVELLKKMPESALMDLNPIEVIPCTSPKYLEPKKVTVIATVKIKGGFTSIKLSLPWQEDIDENVEMIKANVPSPGMLQINDSVAYCARIPVREPTHHGYSPQYHKFEWIGDCIYPNIGFDDRIVIWRMYNKIKHDWHVALDLVESGQLVAAVADRFLALAAVEKKRYTQLYYKYNNVGFVRDGMPVLFAEQNTAALQDYIYKISGVHPLVRS